MPHLKFIGTIPANFGNGVLGDPSNPELTVTDETFARALVLGRQWESLDKDFDPIADNEVWRAQIQRADAALAVIDAIETGFADHDILERLARHPKTRHLDEAARAQAIDDGKALIKVINAKKTPKTLRPRRRVAREFVFAHPVTPAKNSKATTEKREA